MNKPLIVCRLDDTPVFEEAIAAANLNNQIELQSVPKDGVLNDHMLANAEGLLAWNLPPGQLNQMPKLRWVQSMTVGMDSWLSRDDLRDEITLTCARGIHRVQMPESVIGAMLYVTRPFIDTAANNLAHKWIRRAPEPLAEKTLGILGVGTVGAEVARKASVFEMKIIGTRRSGEPLPHVDEMYAPEDTDKVLEQSDFLLTLLPVTADTRDFMNAARFSKMKESAWYLNFTRGDVVVDQDLINAVNSNAIAGAVLDTFRIEPLPPEDPFWSTEGIVVLPHIGGMHPQRGAQISSLVVDNLRAFLDNGEMSAVVDRIKGY
jgi:glyoxylate/hydroxypyruvate reductase A